MLTASQFQSTLPLRGATPPDKEVTDSQDISIHAPLTGSDQQTEAIKPHREISIHAPLTGSDPRQRHHVGVESHFNPRSPYGERLLRRR